MDIAGEYRIAASRQAVWNALNDPEVLKACIPGCQKIEKLSDTDIEAQVLVQLGPVKCTFATRITLNDLNPPISYTLAGEGKAGPVGFGRGEARVVLTEDGNVTVLKYTADLKLGGKLAQVGARLVEGATRKLADDFFASFATRLDAGAQKIASPAPAVAGMSKRMWLIAGAVLAGALLIWWLTN